MEAGATVVEVDGVVMVTGRGLDLEEVDTGGLRLWLGLAGAVPGLLGTLLLSVVFGFGRGIETSAKVEQGRCETGAWRLGKS